MYISFFHGRKDPSEEMNGWGYTGPIVGPCSIGMTYSSFKVYDPETTDFEFVPMKDDLFVIGEDYYGDMYVFDEEYFDEADKKYLISVKEFINKLRNK